MSEIRSKHILPTPEDIYTITQLNREVSELLEEAFPIIWVEGEISNLAKPTSGHLYFTLKDNNAQVRCAFFRNRHTNLRFDLNNGMKVLAKVNVGLYEGRGEYQLIIEQIEPAGAGALQIAFDALKQKLATEGLFDKEHKKVPPKYPKTIGIITSSTGAAIRDILSILKRRYPLGDLIIYPVPVQGDGAAAAIAKKIKIAEKRNECDVFILTRGGGSLEDLWAFNEEVVARTIFDIDTPIISGIGHEIDFTIVDFIVDLRAATPSAAAELVSPDIDEVIQKLKQYKKQLIHFQKQIIKNFKNYVAIFSGKLPQPNQKLFELIQRTDEYSTRLKYNIEKEISSRKIIITESESNLAKLNPMYIITQKIDYIKNLHLQFKSAITLLLEQTKNEVSRIEDILKTISPISTLDRGYAIVSDYKTNKIIRNTTHLKIGKKIHIKLASSEIDSIVDKIYEE